MGCFHNRVIRGALGLIHGVVFANMAFAFLGRAKWADTLIHKVFSKGPVLPGKW